MTTKSVYQFTLVALPVSCIIMLCGHVFSKWPLFVYDCSLKPSLQFLSLYKVIWPALAGFIVTLGIGIYITKVSQIEQREKTLSGDCSIGYGLTFTSISSLLGLWTVFVITISYYMYRWHDIFMFYYYHLLGDIIFIMGFLGYTTLLSYCIFKHNINNSQSMLKESASKL